MDLLRRLWLLARAQVGSRGRKEWEAAGEPAFERPGPQTSSGIDPQLAQYYANLEIPYGTDLETARQAWKRLLKQYHPDLHANDLEKRRVAGELSARLTQAFQELERAHRAKEPS